MSVWEPSQPPSQPHSHSTEVENRLTKLEVQGTAHQNKLTLHEKAILAIASALYVVAQEKFSIIAGAIRGLLIP